MSGPLTDQEREFEARRFFWSMMDRLGQAPSLEVAQRQIAKIAECLPPFTPLSSLLTRIKSESGGSYD